MQVDAQSAQAAYDAGDFHYCISVCSKALTVDNNNAQYLFLLSSSLRRIGNLREARRALILGALKFPGHVKFLIALSEVEYTLGNMQGAIDAAKAGAEIAPADVRLKGQMARSHALIGEIQRARELQMEFNLEVDDRSREQLEEAIEIAALWFDEKNVGPVNAGVDSTDLMTFSDAFTADALDLLRSPVGKQFFHGGTIITASGPITDRTVRNVGVALLGLKEFSKVYLSVYRIAHYIASRFGVCIFPDGPLQLVRYDGTENGHYSWHQDVGPGRHEYRRFTITSGVSPVNAYRGGELQVRSADGTRGLALGAGDVVAFRSALEHRVTPVSQGVRTVVVGWFRAVE